MDLLNVFLKSYPSSCGLAPYVDKREKDINCNLAIMEYYKLQAAVVSTRNIGSGYEWWVHSVKLLSSLFTRESREVHAYLRRKEGFSFSIHPVSAMGTVYRPSKYFKLYLELLVAKK